MGNQALQIQRLAGGNIGATEAVLFDTVVYSAGNILYDPLTGIITFQKPGRYFVNWSVATQTAILPTGIIFALSSSQGEFLQGNSPLKTGEVTGTGIINVVAAPVTLSLVNAVGNNIYYASQLPIKADLIIFSDTSGGLADTSACFSMAQLAHIIEQLIVLYPTSTMSVFTTNLITVTSMPYQLYTSPAADGPGLFILKDAGNRIDIVPLTSIVAIYVGADTVYNPAITYLPPPSPLPLGCDTNLIAAMRDYLPIGTDVVIRLGVAAQASGAIYKSDYGIIVLSDADGNTPIFIPVMQTASVALTE
ncbi:hypothetical protein Sgly_2035 [Syntrophobotulus glycolicus DSM 8271]|uniref:Uncharacterized protein n=1 Tax=Syntrophobotulus glycolicus (strain DSM 8271 / FlGlyR) TaxID=645991 RepID=F0T1I7_SYNGF|nr:hypothetical protein [Syntrophobotulus glycolicus]ADY56328.1 hypothetical protein Sgly_2035 [Syntrophobotulus glycolicus DSM 8271]